MIRKSAVAISLLLLAASFRLNALGLGEIDMISALNQPMNASIGLTATKGVDLSQVNVGLASLAAHERLGLTRDKLLGNFKFSIAKDGRGNPVIKINSSEPVREPYLEFLLELDWENGRMVREYTVLVDPPVTMVAAPVTPVAPVAKAPAIQPAVTEPVTRTAPAPRPPVTSFTSAPAQQRTSSTYGAVRRDEALWSIAKRLRPDSRISVQQMMIALLKANPQAFTDDNINNLKVGSVLTIPERDLILEMTADEARMEAGRQYNEWLELRSEGRSMSAMDAPMAEPEVSVATTTARSSVADSRTEAQLKLTPPEGASMEASATSSGDAADSARQSAVEESLRQQLTLAAEEIEASRAESEELRSRVLQLEDQIQKMQRLLELKSDAFAGLQNNADADAAADGSVDTSNQQPADTQDAKVSEDIAQQEADAAVGAEDAGGVLAMVHGVVGKLKENPVLSGIGALVALLLGGFLWGSSRQQVDAYEEVVPVTGVAGETGSLTAAVETMPEQTDTSEEFETIDVVNGDTDESPVEEASDPITEADVYLAYGRHHQAEDVLQAALQEDPGNLSIRAKLLEVFHASGNVAAFDSAAAEYRELKSDDDDQWEQIATLGYELSPGNVLYSTSVDIPGESGNAVDFDMDLSGMDEIAPVDTDTVDSEDLALSVENETAEAGEIVEHLDFSLEEPEEDDSHSEGVLASSDEVATKLDLARAYLDMEDPEGARGILQEVIEEGSAEQISEAESLISKIG